MATIMLQIEVVFFFKKIAGCSLQCVQAQSYLGCRQFCFVLHRLRQGTLLISLSRYKWFKYQVLSNTEIMTLHKNIHILVHNTCFPNLHPVTLWICSSHTLEAPTSYLWVWPCFQITTLLTGSQPSVPFSVRWNVFLLYPLLLWDTWHYVFSEFRC